MPLAEIPTLYYNCFNRKKEDKITSISIDSTSFCTLCNAELSSHPIVDGGNTFCCTGCHAVYNILEAKNQLGGFEKHPIFIQALRSGLISNPHLLEQIRQQRSQLTEGERERWHLEIGDMWCPSCAEIVKLMLLKERGVINCIVDYATDLASVEFSPRHCSRKQLEQVIINLGYRAVPLDSPERKAVSASLYLRFGVAAFCALNAMMFAYPLYSTYFSDDGEGYGLLFAWLSFIVSLPVLLYSAWPIWKRFWTSLKTGFFGMETLVFLGVSAATSFSLWELLKGGTRVYFDSMTVIVTFVLLGKIVEARAKFSSKESLMRLTRATPRRARKRCDDNTIQFVPIKDVAKGDILVVYCGEKLPLDGIVLCGQGACDESMMTGEPMPVIKELSSPILGGTILVQGHLEYKVSGGVEESALHKIIEMVEQDIGHKTVYVRAADSIVRWFVPVIISLAFFAACAYMLFPAIDDPYPSETAWLRALAVLLISCPCAIGIAAPAAESYLLNALAELGVIVRNRGCLPLLGREETIVFDKTGTVTEGRFSVCSGLEGLNKEQISALHSIASHSTHPVACAIAAASQGQEIKVVNDMEEIAGHGLRGMIDGELYFLGSDRFIKQQGIDVPEMSGTEGAASCVYIAHSEGCIGRINLADRIRPGVQELIQELKKNSTPVLLSGDSEQAVAAIAQLAGFTIWKSGCTPLEKRQFIDKLRSEGGIISMLGDGINDAPALTAAHIGISVVSATDMSIQVSDLLLTTDRLNIILKLRLLGRKGQAIIRQNLFWAFIYNVIGIFLAMFGWLSPIFAAFAMSISSLTVLFNSRRLKSRDEG